MHNLALKIKLSVLWIFMDFASLALLMLNLYDPSAMKQIIAREVGVLGLTPEFLLEGAIILLIPFVMAFLSLTLKDSLNRWANVVLGGFCSLSTLG